MSIIQKMRRNHAAEHATIHILSARVPNLRLAGRADMQGFWLYGDVPTRMVRNAVNEALTRLQAGQVHLALHPRCGTNLAVAGVLAGVSSLLATSGRPRSVISRLPRILLATTLAVLAAQPLGPVVQERVTTSPDLQGVRVKDVIRQGMGRITVHRVLLEESEVSG